MLLINILLLFSLSLSTVQEGQIVDLLHINTPIEKNISSGTTHLYKVTVVNGQYLWVSLNQKSVDAVIKFISPDGKLLIEINSTIGATGKEYLYWIAEQNGDYRIEVTKNPKFATDGIYEIKIEELRQPTQEDRTRVDARKLIAEADILALKGSAETSRKAIERYNESLPLVRTLSDRETEVRVLNNISNLHYYFGERRKSLEIMLLTIPLREAIGDPGGIASTYNALGRLYDDLGEKKISIEYLDRALKFWRTAGDRKGEAMTLNNTGLLYDSIGENQQALDYYTQSLKLRRETGDLRGEAITLSNIGKIYSHLGERERALDLYFQSLKIKHDLGERQSEAVTLNNIGLIYFELKDFNQSLKYYNDALTLWKAVGDKGGEATTLVNIGKVYKKLSEDQKALDNYMQALALWKTTGDKRGEAGTIINLGSHYESVNELDKSFDHFNMSLPIVRAIGDLRLEAEAHYGIARVECKRSNLEKTKVEMEDAIRLIELLRTKISHPDLRASYFSTVQEYYEFYSDILMQLHEQTRITAYLGAALHLSEKAKARSLLELLAEVKADIRKGVDINLVEREKKLQNELNSKSEQLIRLKSGKTAKERLEAAEKEYEELSLQLIELQAQIKSTSPEYANLVQPLPLDLERIRAEVLDSDTVLLEYMLGQKKSYVWVVTKDSISGYRLPGRAEIETTAQRVYDKLTARNRHYETNIKKKEAIAEAEADYSKAALQLSKMILEPVSGELKKKRLLIVSDGALQFVPFSALPFPVKKDEIDFKPLINEFEIVSLPSASTLAVLRSEHKDRKPAPRTIAIFADPVFSASDPRLKLVVNKARSGSEKVEQEPVVAQRSLEVDLNRALGDIGIGTVDSGPQRLLSTRDEAEAIVKFVPDKEQKLALGFDANRDTATSKELEQYRILHFATHGMLNNDHPELSGIVLSLFDKEGRKRDGFFRLHDIYNLQLPAELVVLSACQTGLGKQIGGEGLIGLTRGFMYAGASRIIASLWKVDDEATAELMKYFYEAMLKGGKAPAEALKQAQMEIMKQKRWQSPFYWAAFILQGEIR
jgi:CHAT domain-containing protein